MAKAVEQFGGQERQKSIHREDEMGDVLRKMENLVKDPEWCLYMSDKIAAEYRYFLRQQGSQISMSGSGSSRMNEAKAINNPQELRQTYEFMQQQWGDLQQVKKRITVQVEQAIGEKIITEKDRDFYKKKMRENVVNGRQIVTKEILEKAEKEVIDSLDKRKAEKKEYDDFITNPLVQNGFLHIDKNNKISIPDEEKFMKMSVPDRRKWLKKIQDAKPKAEKYLNEDLAEEYESLLNTVRKKGIMGKKSIEKYIDGFRNIDLEEKKHWIKEMKNGQQLERYVELWKNIRKTLKEGKGLERMETLRNTMGYSELLQAFGSEKEFESQRNLFAYKAKLDGALNKRLISHHIYKAFLGDMRGQTLESQQEYLNQFDEQMERYRTLRGNIDGMKNKDAQSVLNEMYDSGSFGYGEISAKYERLKSQKGSALRSASQHSLVEKALNQIRNDTVKGAARYANEVLDYGEKKTFVERVSRFFTGKVASQQDVSSYQKNVKRARRELSQKEVMPEEESAPLRESDHITNDTRKIDMEESNGLQEKPAQKPKSPSVKIKTNQDQSYQQNTFSGQKEEKRVVRVGIGSKEAVQAFNNERNLDQDQDSLSLMAKDGNRIVELKVNEIRHFTEYLKHTMDSVNDDEEISKAA